MVNSTKSTKSALPSRIKRLERYVATHQGDVKARSLSSAFAPLTTGGVYCLSNLGQGDTYETRAGEKINCQAFVLGALFKMTATASVRIIVVYDRFNVGSIPSVSDILDSADVVSPMNYNNVVVQKRFKVIEDYTEHFSLNGSLAASKRKEHRLQMPIYYNGAGSTSAECRGNNIYAVVVTNTPTAGQVNLYTRLKFTDE